MKSEEEINADLGKAPLRLETSAGSVSRVDCVLSVRDKGTAKLSLYRHLAPLTVNAILRTLPLEGRTTVQPAMCMMFTSLSVGVEKPKLSFERGDVAFLTSGGLLCFFRGPAKSDRPLNPVGKVESGIELLDSIRPGDVVSISQSQA